MTKVTDKKKGCDNNLGFGARWSYARSDLFSKLNRLGTWFAVVQVAILLVVALGLVTLSRGYEAYIIARISGPDNNVLPAYPDIRKGHTYIRAGELEAVKQFRWYAVPGQGDIVHGAEGVEPDWRKMDAAISSVHVRYGMVMENYDRAIRRCVLAYTAASDDPVLKALGFDQLQDSKALVLLVRRDSLGRLDLRPGQTVMRAAGFEKDFKIVIDEENVLPHPAYINENVYHRYMMNKYNISSAGNDRVGSIDIYPQSIDDLKGIAAALDQMGLEYDRDFVLKVRDGMAHIAAVQGFVGWCYKSLMALVGLGLFFQLLHGFEKKRKEIGFMVACGWHWSSVLSIYLLEGVILWCIGGALGMALLQLLGLWADGHAYSWLGGDTLLFSLSSVIPHLVFMYGAVLGILLVAPFVAVWQLTWRCRPVELLRT